jgi:plastocyanin
MAAFIRRPAALASILAMTVACSTATPAPAAPAPAGGATSASIDVQGRAFKTASLEVAKGTAVTWSNKDSFGHTVSGGTPPTKSGAFDGQLAAGGTFSFTFNDTGTFPYFCAIHTSMTGTIVVR